MIAGKIGLLIERHEPERVFIDTTGGYGAGVHDRLAERGLPVYQVNFGSRANDSDQYLNKRVEMYAKLRDWLADPGGADIVDDDLLAGDLCAPTCTQTSSGQLKLEGKDEIRKRIGRSPDAGDAAALTFAMRFRPRSARIGAAPVRTESSYDHFAR